MDCRKCHNEAGCNGDLSSQLDMAEGMGVGDDGERSIFWAQLTSKHKAGNTAVHPHNTHIH